MGGITTAILQGLPATVSSIFVLAVVLGVTYIIAAFIFKAWKTSIQIQNEHEERSESKNEALDTTLKLLEKVGEIKDNYAGRYASIDEMERFKTEISEKIRAIEVEIAILRKEFNLPK